MFLKVMPLEVAILLEVLQCIGIPSHRQERLCS